MNDFEVLLKVFELWGSLRIRNPASPEDLAARDVIRVELEERFGELPKRAPRGTDTPTHTSDGLEILYNPRLTHGIALKRHAHPIGDIFKDHLHGPSSHAY